MKRLVALTGAGISAESGIQTFRGDDGLWEGHDVMDVASPVGWAKDQQLVLDFYNARRRQLLKVQPNNAHKALAELESYFDITIVTQNIDDLHERAGSTDVLHLHGELLVARSSSDESVLYPWDNDIVPGDLCELGSQLRPHVVWFGEAVPMMEPAMEVVRQSDIILVIGTSLQVYPAASLVSFAENASSIIYIDPSPAPTHHIPGQERLQVIKGKAGEVLPVLVEQLRKEFPLED